MLATFYPRGPGMSEFTLEAIRGCLEGMVPGAIATSDAEGMPNVTYLSQAMYVDPNHIALSFQFFNKTRRNIQLNGCATLLLMDPITCARYRLQVEYLRTETSGPLFESMRAKLAGIASHEGMVGIFVLRGADLYKVVDIEHVAGAELPPPSRSSILPGLRAAVGELQQCSNMDALLDCVLQVLQQRFAIEHALVLMADTAAQKLFTVASCGYQNSGVGAEVPYGVGVIGVAAEQGVPIRLMFAAADYVYSRAIREAAIQSGLAEHLEASIPLPGLPSPASQMAIPVVHRDQLLAVVYVESQQSCRFDYDLEDALVVLSLHFGQALRLLDVDSRAVRAEAPRPTPPSPATPSSMIGPASQVQYFRKDHSVFIDQKYLIKGVAGAVLWRLLTHYQRDGRDAFSNRELRRDAELPLPDIGDNLEARLLLLARRLEEQCPFIRITKPGRGLIRLQVGRALTLAEQ